MDPIAKILGEWAMEMNIASVLLRVGLAVAFAAAIGCERANKRHSAGLRTFILVSLASVAGNAGRCVHSDRGAGCGSAYICSYRHWHCDYQQ